MILGYKKPMKLYFAKWLESDEAAKASTQRRPNNELRRTGGIQKYSGVESIGENLSATQAKNSTGGIQKYSGVESIGENLSATQAKNSTGYW